MIKKAEKYFTAAVGVAIGAFSLVVLLKPGNMAPGGISAIAVMLTEVIPLKTGTVLFLLNIPLLLAAFILDKQFFKTTVLGAVFYSVFANLASLIPVPKLDGIIRSLFGGALLGAGLGMVFSVGGSTGGSDIIAWIIKRKNPGMKMGRAILLVDIIIIAVQALLYKSLQSGLYAALALIVSVMVVDRVIEGKAAECKTVFIISDLYKKISASVMGEIGRGVTALMARGMYTDTDKKVLFCSVTVKQLPSLMKIISDIDSDAFVIVADTREVSGNGFNNIDR